MNYLAHGYRFLDRPAFLVGTAVPDWLSVCDRSLRLEPESVARARDQVVGDDRSTLLDGVTQHLEDDHWFHNNPLFERVTREVARDIRRVVPEPKNFRANFLAHVLIELLIDSTLIERDGELLDAYYETLDRVRFSIVQDTVEHTVGVVPERLSHLVERFRESEFLRHYPEDDLLFDRLRQVARRAGLPPVPAVLVDVIPATRTAIRAQAEALLPPTT